MKGRAGCCRLLPLSPPQRFLILPVEIKQSFDYHLIVWWFKRQKEPTKALRALQDDFEVLRRDMDNLQLDWSTVYDKIRKTMGRITKSAAILEAGQQPEVEGVPAPGMAPDPRVNPERAFALDQIRKRRGGG